MRKIAAFILCLMLIAAPALAEVYTSNTGLFTYECPDNYVPITGQLMDALLNGDMSSMIQNEMGNIGYEQDVIEEMFGAFSGLDFSDLDFVFTPDFVGNVNIYAQRELGLTQDMLPMIESVFDEQMVSTYAAMGVAEEDCAPQGVQTFGSDGNQYYVFYVNMPGDMVMHQHMTFNDAGDQIVATFTDFPLDAELALVESIKLL